MGRGATFVPDGDSSTHSRTRSLRMTGGLDSVPRTHFHTCGFGSLSPHPRTWWVGRASEPRSDLPSWSSAVLGAADPVGYRCRARDRSVGRASGPRGDLPSWSSAVLGRCGPGRVLVISMAGTPAREGEREKVIASGTGSGSLRGPADGRQGCLLRQGRSVLSGVGFASAR